MTNPVDNLYKPSVLLDRLNPSQREAVTIPRHQAIKVVAGAGTGKTYLMAHRFIHLVQELIHAGIEQPQEKILAVTFTVKAAQEMKDRINRLMKSYGLGVLSSDAYISNYHGFCNRVLRAHALDVGLTRDFSIINGLEKTVLWERILQGISHGDYTDSSVALSRSGLSDVLFPDILSLSRLTSLPMGSVGRDIHAFLDDLPGVIDQVKSAGLSPRAFYDQTHAQTSRWTDYLKQFPLGVSNPASNASESFDSSETCCRIWQDYLKHYAENSWQMAGDLESQWFEDLMARERAFKERIAWLNNAFKVDGLRPFPLHKGSIQKTVPQKLVYETRDVSFLSDMAALEATCIDVVTAVYAVYQYELHRHDRCDFDDLINRTLELFSLRPDIRTHYQQWFEHIIVDEFQDSNGSQLELIRQLIRPDEPPDETNGKARGHTNVTVIGDQKQSIYRFRHAQPENMDLLFENRPHHTVTLQTNYRSTAPILDVANQVALDITQDVNQKLVADASVLNVRRDNSPSLVAWVTVGQTTTRIDSKGQEKIDHEPISGLRWKEARYIAAQIVQMITREGYSPNDIAVLVKNHSEAEGVGTALRRLGIPAFKEKTLGFFDQPVILDAMALLKLLHHGLEEGALIRLLEKKLNHRQLRLLAQYRKVQGIALFQALEKLSDTIVCPDIPYSVRVALVNLTEEIKQARKTLAYQDVPRVFLSLAQRIGLIDPEEPTDAQVEKRALLSTFKKLLYQFTHDQALHPSLSEIINALIRYREDSRLDLPAAEVIPAENAVRILTMHVAKGLEFKVVFAACVDFYPWPSLRRPFLVCDPQYGHKPGFGLFFTRSDRCKANDSPTTLKWHLYKHIWEAPREMVEAKRLFYVALTRARERLYVIRGTTSYEWTAPQHFPPHAIAVLNEEDDPDAFASCYEKMNESVCRKAVEQTLIKPVPSGDIHPKLSAQSAYLSQRVVKPENSAATLCHTPLVLSFSALHTYRQCPVRYALAYEWRLSEPPATLHRTAGQMAMARGSCIHAVIQRHYVRQGVLDDATLHTLMDHYLPEPNNPDHPDRQRQTVEQLYRQFLQSPYTYKALTCHTDVVLESEKAIRFPLLPISKETTQNGSEFFSPPIDVSGQIDLLLFHSASQTYTLVDFKTNQTLTPEKDALYFEQLGLYREGLKILYPDRSLPDTHLMRVHLTKEGVKTRNFEDFSQRSPFHLEDLREEAKAIWRQGNDFRETGQLPERPPAVDCVKQQCPYLGVCPKAISSGKSSEH